MPEAVTVLAFAAHIAAGTVALVSGAVAIVAPKGRPLHRRAGTIFFGAMLLVAIFAAYLAVVRPGQLVNLIIALFALYLVSTAWLTVRGEPGQVAVAERLGLVVAMLLAAPFVVLSVQLAAGLPTFLKSAVPLDGPVRVALYAFTIVLAIAAASDAKVVLASGIAGAPRIARHLWRMCLGLTLATGSAFTNGFARLLPGFHGDVPSAFFLPQFIPLVLMAMWLIRVRLAGWKTPESATPAG